ncbi:molybdopterin-synthase adenylyltransferase MoeB [Synechococcus sp. CS-1325]|uniref:molybdopterin-synthase adenylyltransferase MoeB n=1 Tax=unclassified Synechococcus TaxID=2626047 RepID=UPI000DB341AA|nr:MULTISPECIES: molybdopterin-synthase adenylyltransferase MoeB [unclassified Synechococcus]MCT0198513.1 molybdopterin-synthase adenylyltransferase MoeB [Synechococcus sp. CS-1325]MCT0229323.1 molybdopterin-synthase adenylyltransferase MoeB [Synechococcus sp. CS-1324]PZU96816.1 MAG: molybdenum cofactor biosynthesis protein MoeB [Cyanobium sp.]PZV06225.1 MAG: molybdenum cofactor biosynthesis protein MoeB [Cyanobium sp.]
MLPPDTTGVQLSPDEVARFSRHLILPEVGMEGQKRLKAASVLCVGTGGLGSPLLLYLAAAGVGRLGIVDFDVVDTSNLQRQVIHGTSWVGKPKIESAKHRIHEINPHCQVDLYETALTSENALEIIEPYDLVCDGTDNFPTRYLVNDACVLLGKPNVYGSIFRFEGQATVFNLDAASPNYRDLFPEPPPPGMVPSCAEGGVVGVLPGIIGMIQATEAVKIITGIGTSLSGRLLLFDALKMSFRELKLRPSPERPVIDRLIDYQEFCGVGGSAPGMEEAGAMRGISVTDLKALLDRQPAELLLLDVRNPPEAEIAVIPGAVLIPLDRIESGEAVEEVRRLAAGKQLHVHCKLGGRSAKALLALQRHGIEGVNVDGGINAWSREVDPSVPLY